MVAVTGRLRRYVVGFLYPNVMSGSNPRPLSMALIAVLFSIFVGLDCIDGRGASHGRQPGHQRDSDLRTACFSVLAIGYRTSHPAEHRPSSTTDRHWPPMITIATAKEVPIIRDSAPQALLWLDRGGQRFPSSSTIPRKDPLWRPSLRHTSAKIGNAPAQLQLHVHSGNGPPISDSGWALNRLPRWEPRQRSHQNNTDAVIASSDSRPFFI